MFLENTFYETTHIVEDITGLMEATLNAEISWNNIVMESIQTEYNAIKLESQDLLTEAKDSWWTKVKQWFKERWEQLKRFISSTIEKIMNFFDFAGRYVEKNKEALASFKGKVSVKAYKWTVKNSSVFEQLMKINEPNIKDDKQMTTDEISKEIVGCSFDSISETISKKVRKGNEKETVSFDTGSVSAFAKSCKVARSSKALLKTSFESIAKLVQLGIKTAETGAASTDDENLQKKYKNQASNGKTCLTVLNKVKSTSLSLYTAFLKDALKVCKAAVKESKKKESFDFFA